MAPWYLQGFTRSFTCSNSVVNTVQLTTVLYGKGQSVQLNSVISPEHSAPKWPVKKQHHTSPTSHQPPKNSPIPLTQSPSHPVKPQERWNPMAELQDLLRPLSHKCVRDNRGAELDGRTREPRREEAQQIARWPGGPGGQSEECGGRGNYARAESGGPGGLGESWGVEPSASDALVSSSSSVCSALW